MFIGHLNPRKTFIVNTYFIKTSVVDLVCLLLFINSKCIERLLCERYINLILFALPPPQYHVLIL